MPWLRPDGKTQVTIEYKKDGGAMIPIRVHTILISTQHSPDVTNDKIHADLMEYVIKPVVPSKYMDDKTIFHLNPSGAARPPAHDNLSACSLLRCVLGPVHAGSHGSCAYWRSVQCTERALCYAGNVDPPVAFRSVCCIPVRHLQALLSYSGF